MSSSEPARNKKVPVYTKVWSVRTIFLLIITGVGLFLAFVLLWAGANIMNTVISQFGAELMHEKLNALIRPLDLPHETSMQSDQVDSKQHPGIQENVLAELSGFRFRNSGSVFIIGKDQAITLSHDFLTRMDHGFDAFFTGLESEIGTIEYSAADHQRFAVYRFYQPWNSYIGLAIDKKELFAAKDAFIHISLMLVTALLLATILFSGFIQRLIITPLIRLTHYADRISKGDYDVELHGSFPFEMGGLKTDIQQMVDTLRQRMDKEKAQVQIIREREIWLDDALSALQDSEKKYRTIYNAPTEAILIYDPVKKKIMDANKAMLGMFGLHHDDIGQLSFGELGGGEMPFSEQKTENRATDALKKGPQLFEWMMRKTDGELFWGEISLQSSFIEEKKCIIAVIRNIHARKMADQELASEKERLAVTLRSIGDGVITADINGRIILMNTIAEKLTGWRQAEAAGRKFQEIFHIMHSDTGRLCADPVDKILNTGLRIELDENTILVAKNGTRRNIADSGAPIFDPESRVIGAVIVFRDVTEEKRMEEELFKVKKLESVGVLAGGIAHDFNNILVAVLGNLSLARQRLDDPEEAKKLLLNTEKAALRAKDLTAQLLTFSRGGEPVIQTASIAELIQESAEFVLRGSTVKAVFDISDDLWLVNVDTGQISQVIQNIVLNARQAIPEQGTVTISSHNCTGCGSGPDPLRKQCVRVVIHDNGPGIAAETLSKIFDPYFSTKDDGSGLGLAICHSIIRKHHAHISVESTPGEGTTFTIQLPVSFEQKVDNKQTIPMHRPPDVKASILVMDDDAMILELATQMLGHLGHEVTTCKDGQACLNLYEKALIDKAPYDLVIMDLTIPGGMGGAKAVRELLKLDPQARAIVSSGYSNDQVMAEYAEHGFKAVVVKPYQLEDLDKAVQDTLKS